MIILQFFEFASTAHLADEIAHFAEQIHSAASDGKADEMPLLPMAPHLAFALM